MRVIDFDTDNVLYDVSSFHDLEDIFAHHEISVWGACCCKRGIPTMCFALEDITDYDLKLLTRDIKKMFKQVNKGIPLVGVSSIYSLSCISDLIVKDKDVYKAGEDVYTEY